jgi:hypothetical protein
MGLGTNERSPRAHAPLQRASNAGGDLGMAPPDFFKHGNRPDPGGRLQDWHNPPSQTSADGSGRRRPCGGFFCEGRRGSSSNR